MHARSQLHAAVHLYENKCLACCIKMRTTDVVERYWFIEANYVQTFVDVHVGSKQLRRYTSPGLWVVKQREGAAKILLGRTRVGFLLFWGFIS
jgi:hypothetical protein